MGGGGGYYPEFAHRDAPSKTTDARLDKLESLATSIMTTAGEQDKPGMREWFGADFDRLVDQLEYLRRALVVELASLSRLGECDLVAEPLNAIPHSYWDESWKFHITGPVRREART